MLKRIITIVTLLVISAYGVNAGVVTSLSSSFSLGSYFTDTPSPAFLIEEAGIDGLGSFVHEGMAPPHLYEIREPKLTIGEAGVGQALKTDHSLLSVASGEFYGGSVVADSFVFNATVQTPTMGPFVGQEYHNSTTDSPLLKGYILNDFFITEDSFGENTVRGSMSVVITGGVLVDSGVGLMTMDAGTIANISLILEHTPGNIANFGGSLYDYGEADIHILFVPEPSTVLLLSSAALLRIRKRKI